MPIFIESKKQNIERTVWHSLKANWNSGAELRNAEITEVNENTAFIFPTEMQKIIEENGYSLESTERWIMDTDPVANTILSVGLRIRRLYPLQRGKTPTPPPPKGSVIRNMILNCIKWWGFSSGKTLHCHYSQLYWLSSQISVIGAPLQLLGHTSAGRIMSCMVRVWCTSSLEIPLASGGTPQRGWVYRMVPEAPLL